MNRYPLWQYSLLLFILTVGVLYALPNLYGQQPAVQISGTEGNQISAQQVPRVEQILQQADINYAGVSAQDGHILVRFKRNEAQLLAAEALQRELGDQFVTAPALAPQTPQWLRAINAQPMSLGLDLRGGVHFLIQVDMDKVYEDSYERYARNIPDLLREKSIRYSRIWPSANNVRLQFKDVETRKQAVAALR